MTNVTFDELFGAVRPLVELKKTVPNKHFAAKKGVSIADLWNAPILIWLKNHVILAQKYFSKLACFHSANLFP